MADSNKIELVVTVEVDRANQSIKSVNAGLSSIEQTAAKSAKVASHGIDGMTAAMVKGATAGNLFADTIKKALEWAKEWTIGAARMAAQEARLEASGRALAKAHGIAGEAFEKAVEAVRKIGYHGEDAIHTIDRLIIADIELSKGVGLAKIAKDAAAIENISAAEALENILRAIEFGNARALRSAGLRVDFEKEIQIAELQLGKTLSENEKVQIRYNAVVRAAAAIQGAHAGAAGEAEAQMKALSREVHELREAVGAQFQDQFKWLVGTFRDLVKWLSENTDLLVRFGQAAIYVAGILTSYALAKKIMDLAKSIAALNLASLNPYAVLAAGVIAGGAIIYSTWKDTEAQMQERMNEMERRALRQDVFSGKTRIEDLRKKGMTDDQIREMLTGRRALPGEGFGFEGPKISIKMGNEPDIDALKRAAEIRKKQAEAEKQTYESASAAEGRTATGAGKIVLEMQKEIAKYTSFVDERGITQRMQLTAKTRENLERELRAKLMVQQREDMTGHLKSLQEEYQQRLAWETDLYQKKLQYDVEVAAKNLEHLHDVYQFEEQRAGFGRDAQLRAVEATDAQTLRQKLWVEQRKMEIEVEYLEKVEQIKLRLFDMETSRMALEEQAALRRLGYRAEEIDRRIAELTQQREDLRQQISEQTGAAVTAARETAAIRQTQLIRDQNRQIFESFKRQAEGVFDALLTKSQSIWSAIGNSLKTALLTAIKDVVTSRVAALLMQLFTGARVGIAPGGLGGGGALGRLGGILGIGAVPVFGGGAVPGLGGFGIPGAPGGTGGFAGPVSIGGSPVGLGRTGGAWGANLAGFLPGLKSFFGIGGSVQLGPGMATTWQAATLGQKLSSIGHSTGALLAGGMLAYEGLRRGGASGLAMTTAGGALIGFKYGGPLGAAIGAAAGAIAGIVRLFVKGATEKAREKIKAIYGVDISDKAILRQIVDTAKQGFGGNLDVAIRSPQIRELVELYAMSTGQKMTGGPATMRPAAFVQSGGSLFESPSYQNGSMLPASGSLRVLGGGTSGTATPQPIVVKLDGPATTLLLRGEAVQAMADNPRVVQGATMKAAKANAGRREMLSLQVSPGTLTS